MVEQQTDCELVIIGAGIAGLNALHSASCYLGKSDKVVLVDGRDAPGGMWRDTYDFVRLHQPHQMFTAGDIPWKQQFVPSHLADKGEVLEQMDFCFETLSNRVDLDARFAHRYISHEERDGVVDVVIESADGTRTQFTTKRLIKAIGYDVTPKDPLPFTSDRVNSISPNQDVFYDEAFRNSDAPIFVVGGGKTGMDAAHHLVTAMPGRAVHMIVGQGVMFAEREKQFPSGIKRWLVGRPGLTSMLRMSQYFDGNNLEDANRYRLRDMGLSLTDEPRQFQFGFLSMPELQTVKNGIASTIETYLEDIVDGEDGARLQFRNGEHINVPAGSYIVNCSGYIGRQKIEYEPYISPTGKVLSINQSSLPFFLTTFAGYFLTHLMYLDKILEVPLYTFNGPDLNRVNKSTVGTVMETLTIMNMLQLTKAVPPKLFNECRLDISRWYPFPRRIPIMSKLVLRGDRYAAHCKQSLDRVAKATGVEIGPLPHVGNQTANQAA